MEPRPVVMCIALLLSMVFMYSAVEFRLEGETPLHVQSLALEAIPSEEKMKTKTGFDKAAQRSGDSSMIFSQHKLDMTGLPGSEAKTAGHIQNVDVGKDIPAVLRGRTRKRYVDNWRMIMDMGVNHHLSVLASREKVLECGQCRKHSECGTKKCYFGKCVRRSVPEAHSVRNCFRDIKRERTASSREECASCRYGNDCDSGYCYRGKCIYRQIKHLSVLACFPDAFVTHCSH